MAVHYLFQSWTRKFVTTNIHVFTFRYNNVTDHVTRSCLQDKHNNYIALLSDDDEEKVAEEDSWLDDAQTQFESLQIEVMALKGNSEQEKPAAL